MIVHVKNAFFGLLRVPDDPEICRPKTPQGTFSVNTTRIENKFKTCSDLGQNWVYSFPF